MAVTPALALTTGGGQDRASTGSTQDGPAYKVVASGLDNPRQLAFDRHGDLYVAESGHGGAGPCIPAPDDPSVQACFGTSGAITKVHDGRGRQVVTGLPSLAAQVPTQGGQLPPGAEAAGPSDVAGRGRHQIAFTIGLGGDPANRFMFSASSTAGHLLSTVATARVNPRWAPFRRTGIEGVRQRGDLAAFEAVNNPAPPADLPDTNANAVLPVGHGFVVADAGGNDLLWVSRSGKVSLITTFPPAKACTDPSGAEISPQAVPTSVVRGPDHAYYVSELTGFPFCEGEAVVWKVKDGHASVYASGLTNVTDLAFDDGRLYAVEIAEHGLLNGPMGAVVAVPRGGGDEHQVVADGLLAPYGIALRHGAAYVTVGSVLPASAGGGQVVRIPLHHRR